MGRGGSEPTLPELVTAARAGDRAALDGLVRTTYADTYTLAFRLTGNEHDARDVVQETYLRACRGMRRFRGEAQFATWLYRITANCASTADARRARNRTEVLSDELAPADSRLEHDPEFSTAAIDDRNAVAAALGQLPAGLRQVIVLRDIYDLRHGAIAAELGITEAAAKVRLHRARRRLRDVLTETGVAEARGWQRRAPRQTEPEQIGGGRRAS
jgi:RNA polymerase sigma-70 factor (ECF subfamily)